MSSTRRKKQSNYAFAEAYLEKVSLDPLFESVPPSPNLTLIVAIPASNEPELLKTLHSLRKCSLPAGDVEVIVILNSSEFAPTETVKQNQISEQEINVFCQDHSNQKFRVLSTNLTGIKGKDAGAGFARKTAMDHALSRFNKLERPEGIIISLDADTICEQNYFTSIEDHFISNTNARACSVYFEHPLEGNIFPASVYSGITNYELHLRYYIEGLRYSGHPHAYHTIGSAFCIRSGTYVSQGGMNKRSAGEDFYFLQKIIPLGGYSDLNTTCVKPSPRPSMRVAFGTGPVVNKFLSGEIHQIDTYNPNSFHDLKEFISSIPHLYTGTQEEINNIYKSWPESIKKNLENEFFGRLEEIKKNSASEETFRKRFFRWFNMFRTLKYINFANKEFHSKIPVEVAAGDFILDLKKGSKPGLDARQLLQLYRKIQRSSKWPD